MTIIYNALTNNSTIVDATSFTTASITPTYGSLQLAVVKSRVAAGPTAPTASGNSLTWVSALSWTPLGSTLSNITVFRAMGTPTAGAVTFDYAAQTQQHCIWNVFELSGADITGTNGSGAIVQTATGGDGASGATSGLLTLSAFGSTNNMAIGIFVHYVNESTTVGSGFTQIGLTQLSENATSFLTEYKLNDNTIDASWSTSSFYGIGGIEIKAYIAPKAGFFNFM